MGLKQGAHLRSQYSTSKHVLLRESRFRRQGFSTPWQSPDGQSPWGVVLAAEATWRATWPSWVATCARLHCQGANERAPRLDCRKDSWVPRQIFEVGALQPREAQSADGHGWSVQSPTSLAVALSQRSSSKRLGQALHNRKPSCRRGDSRLPKYLFNGHGRRRGSEVAPTTDLGCLAGSMPASSHGCHYVESVDETRRES